MLKHFLSITIFLPALFGLFLFFIPQSKTRFLKFVSLNGSILTFLMTLGILCYFTGTAEVQFVEKYSWIPLFGVSYFIGIDGLSLYLFILTSFLTPLVLLYVSPEEKKLKPFLILILFLETAMLGTFAALDLILFYIFWEAMLIPMYFMIGVWGGEERLYATIKFLLYTILGSFLMLVALIALVMIHHSTTGVFTTNLLKLYGTPLGSLEMWLFLGFALAFLIKVPLFPFHTWLPDAHVQAPTEGSVILAGILLKMGMYGLFRFALPLFPQASMAVTPYVVTLALIGIIYGAFLAWAQKDLKKLVAYSSVSHLGYAVLGLFVLNHTGVTGSLVQNISHGLATGALFFIVGMIYKRTHTKKIEELGGLASSCPKLFFFFLIATLASIGLPLTSGFVGEILCLFGAFQEYGVQGFAWGGETLINIRNIIFGTVGILGVLMGAIYMLNMFQKVMFGKPKFEDLKDLEWKEVLVLTPLIIMIFSIGVYPKLLTNKMENSIDHLVKNVYKYSLTTLSFPPEALGTSGNPESEATSKKD
ncbi:MAG: NADH-quinone oxidoreductase subunit M [Deltaproteobacteria bacterium]|nr:NADH-quinone oxidoreductase subunit M [Deltaproteobacteria bacterium]